MVPASRHKEGRKQNTEAGTEAYSCDNNKRVINNKKRGKPEQQQQAAVRNRMRTAWKARSVAKCGLRINGMTMKGTNCGCHMWAQGEVTPHPKKKGEKINEGKRPRQARRLQMSCACSATKLSSVWMSFEAAHHITYTTLARIMLTPSPSATRWVYAELPHEYYQQSRSKPNAAALF